MGLKISQRDSGTFSGGRCGFIWLRA